MYKLSVQPSVQVARCLGWKEQRLKHDAARRFNSKKLGLFVGQALVSGFLGLLSRLGDRSGKKGLVCNLSISIVMSTLQVDTHL